MARRNGGSGADALLGTDSADVIVGRAGRDTLNGLGGDDRLEGGDDNDILYGGAGDDLYLPGDNNDYDRLVMGAGNDVANLSGHDPGNGFSYYDLVYSHLEGPISAVLRGSVWRIEKSDGSVDRVRGFPSDGEAVRNFGVGIDGTLGADRMVADVPAGMFVQFSGRGGDDTMIGGAGFDRVATFAYAAPTRFVVKSSGPDGMNGRIRDAQGDRDVFRKIDELRGSDRDDRFIGSGGADRFITDGGNDFVNGRGGFDMLNYDRFGLDGIRADLARNRIDETWVAGPDSGRGQFRDTVRNVERIRASDGDDRLFGSGRAELFEGRDGDDVLIGRRGDDTLIGGAGEDRYVYRPGHGDDLIRFFEHGADLIRLKRGGGVRDFDDLSVRSDGDAAVVAYRDVTITFEDTRRSEIDASDFDFFG